MMPTARMLYYHLQISCCVVTVVASKFLDGFFLPTKFLEKNLLNADRLMLTECRGCHTGVPRPYEPPLP